MSKHQRTNWVDFDPIFVWKVVRDQGDLKVFPNNYLTKDICKTLVRELLLNELNMSREEILNVKQDLLSKYKLGGVRKLFDCKIYELLNYCFPEFDIHPWELTKMHPHLWEDEGIRSEFVLWVAKKENIDITNMDDLSKFSAKMIIDYGGSKPLKYAGGLYELIKPVIDPNFKEWQIFIVSRWDKDKVVEAVKWLIEDELKWDLDTVYNKLTAKVFYENDLGGLLSKYCHNSPFEAFNLAYPNTLSSLKRTFHK